MHLKLRRDLVLVEPYEQPSKIIIPDAAKRGSKFGKVVNAGSETGVTPGDSIAFDEHVGERTNIHGKTLLVMKAEDVLAIV